MVGWRLKGGWLLLMSDSPWQSPYTNSFNNTSWYNAVIQLWRQVQKLLLSVQPFAVTKCLDWLVSKESPLPSYTEFCCNILLHPPACHHLLPVQKTKNTSFTNPSIPNIMGRLNICARMSAYGQVVWGVQQVASEPPRTPGCYTVSFLGLQRPGHCIDHPPITSAEVTEI
jgi:hypothetical protein